MRVAFHAAIVLAIAGAYGEHPDWAISAEQTGPIPLPLQAARIQFTVKNRGSTAFATVTEATSARLVAIRRPGTSEFKALQGQIFSFGQWIDGSAFGSRSGKVRVGLAPGEMRVADFSMALFWDGKETQFLFPVPGTYLVRVGWNGPYTQKWPYIETDPVRIEIAEPRGHDKEVYELLKANEPLAIELLSARTSPKFTYSPLLQRIVDEFPDSSYADYARFGLARSYLNRGEDEERPHNERIFAINMLQSIDPRKFAYGDYALARLATELDLIGLRAAGSEAHKKLDDLYPNSTVRLDDLVPRMSEEEWRQNNPRAPIKAK